MPDLHPATYPRLDIYGPMHKAMRLAMGEALGALGRAEAGDAPHLLRALDQVEELLEQLRLQLRHERDFVHTAIEAKRPGASRALAELLAEHDETAHELRAQLERLRRAPDPAGLQSLYRQLALFVADNLNRMARQESAHGAMLWTLYGDAELRLLQARQLAALHGAELHALLGWMARALGPGELLPLLHGMREVMGADFESLGLARHATH